MLFLDKYFVVFRFASAKTEMHCLLTIISFLVIKLSIKFSEITAMI